MPYELIAGALSGLAGFIFKAHANSIEGLKQVAELQIKQQMTADQLANSAAERSSPFARKILAFIVVGVIFGGLLLMGVASLWNPDATVSLVSPQDQKSILWGLVKWGGSMKVTVAHGFVLPDWTGWVIATVVGFFLGTGAAKPVK